MLSSALVYASTQTVVSAADPGCSGKGRSAMPVLYLGQLYYATFAIFFAAWYFPLIFQTGRKPPGRDNHCLPLLQLLVQKPQYLGIRVAWTSRIEPASYCALYITVPASKKAASKSSNNNRPDVALLLLLDHLWTESQQTTLPMWAANTILYFNLLTWESLIGWYSYKQPTKNKDCKGLKESTRACSISNTTRRANDPLKPNVNACYDGCIVLHAAACCM